MATVSQTQREMRKIQLRELHSAFSAKASIQWAKRTIWMNENDTFLNLKPGYEGSEATNQNEDVAVHMEMTHCLRVAPATRCKHASNITCTSKFYIRDFKHPKHGITAMDFLKCPGARSNNGRLIKMKMHEHIPVAKKKQVQWQ